MLDCHQRNWVSSPGVDGLVSGLVSGLAKHLNNRAQSLAKPVHNQNGVSQNDSAWLFKCFGFSTSVRHLALVFRRRHFLSCWPFYLVIVPCEKLKKIVVDPLSWDLILNTNSDLQNVEVGWSIGRRRTEKSAHGMDELSTVYLQFLINY